MRWTGNIWWKNLSIRPSTITSRYASCADDVVLPASSAGDLWHAPEKFAAECESAGMRISTSKSEAMVLCRKKVDCSLWVCVWGGGYLNHEPHQHLSCVDTHTCLFPCSATLSSQLLHQHLFWPLGCLCQYKHTDTSELASHWNLAVKWGVFSWESAKQANKYIFLYQARPGKLSRAI